MWNGQRVAVVLPTYNEHLSIAECIRAFSDLGVVDDDELGARAEAFAEHP